MKVTLVTWEKLTIRELNYIEDRIGPWAKVERSGHRLQALFWATMHRTDPDFAWEDTEAVELGAMEYKAVPPVEAGPDASETTGSRPSVKSSAGARRTRSGI